MTATVARRLDMEGRADLALYDFLMRRLEVQDRGERLDLTEARARVDAAVASGKGIDIRAAMIEEAVACLEIARRLPEPPEQP